MIGPRGLQISTAVRPYKKGAIKLLSVKCFTQVQSCFGNNRFYRRGASVQQQTNSQKVLNSYLHEYEISSELVELISRHLAMGHKCSDADVMKFKQTAMKICTAKEAQLPHFVSPPPLTAPTSRRAGWANENWQEESLQRILHLISCLRPLDFWTAVASMTNWIQPYTYLLDRTSQSNPQWFVGGKVNVCKDALDQHIERGAGDTPALHWDSPLTNNKCTLTYKQLLYQVVLLARGLKRLNLSSADTVLIYMPVIPEAVVTMLACARLGIPHCAVFGGFGLTELKKRIETVQPKVCILASAGVEPSRVVPYKDQLVSALRDSIHSPNVCVVLQRPEFPPVPLDPSRDICWHTLMKESQCEADTTNFPYKMKNEDLPVPVSSNHPLYLLYTSGTTAAPKGIIRDHGGQICSSNFALPAVYDVRAKDVFFAAGDIGWVLSHSLSVYGPLIVGATSVLYEGKPVGTPDTGSLFRLCDEYSAKGIFTTPSALRAIAHADPDGEALRRYELKNLQGWPIAAPLLGLNDNVPKLLKLGRTGALVPGWNLHVLEADQRGDTSFYNIPAEDTENNMTSSVKNMIKGSLAIRLPLPPGAAVNLFDGFSDFQRTYLTKFPGYFDTKDVGTWFKDDSMLRVDRRDDEVINVAAHRLSTATMEEVLSQISGAVEVAVVAVHDKLRGQVPVAFMVLSQDKKNASDTHETFVQECSNLLRREVGAITCLKNVIVVNRLPRNHSNKVLRNILAQLAEGEEIDDRHLAISHDVAIIAQLKEAIRAQPCPKN